MGRDGSRSIAALQLLLRAFGVKPTSPRKVAAHRASRPAVEVTSDYGIAPTFPGVR
jgi:hypothetical protein